MAKYDICTTHNGMTYVRALSSGSATTNDFLSDMQAATTVTRSDGLAVLAHLSRYIIECMGEGRTVTIDGVGTFAPTFALKDSTQGNMQRRITNSDVALKRITFKASPEMRKKVGEQIMFRRVDILHRQSSRTRLSLDERREIAVQMASTNAERFLAPVYARKAGVSLFMAYKDLARFAKEGMLSVVRYGRYRLYGRARVE